MNACTPIFGNLGDCVTGTLSSWAAGVPWWGWVALALIVAGIVYKLAGWLGIVALAGVAGYGAKTLQDARKPADHYPTENGDGEPYQPPQPRPHQRTIFDIFRGQ